MATPAPHREATLTELYEQLMTINRRAFAAGHYDAAYHVLMAALHCAQSLKDVESLGEVQRTAEEELAWIDKHRPEYEHSTRSAHQRGHTSIYLTLAHQAQSRGRIITSEAQQQATRSHKPDSEG